MGIEVPLPPPRNDQELAEQIRYYERRLKVRALMQALLWESAALATIIILSIT